MLRHLCILFIYSQHDKLPTKASQIEMLRTTSSFIGFECMFKVYKCMFKAFEYTFIGYKRRSAAEHFNFS